jgi:hypothetical protein
MAEGRRTPGRGASPIGIVSAWVVRSDHEDSASADPVPWAANNAGRRPCRTGGTATADGLLQND